jgi:iron complex transport system ATP-binding protein
MEACCAIEATNLSFGYNGALTLTNLSFKVAAGEMIALIGANGTGKTTLLKLLLGLLQPTSGAIALFNSPLSSYAPKERAKQIAYVSQQPPANFPLTVSELVALGRYPYAARFGLSAEDRAAVEAALERTRSKPLSARRFSTLSGGEQQKVLIARAMAQSAKILLLDEPTLHLDLRYQVQILAGLRELCGQKRVTVITVLHDINLVSIFADKVLLLGGGRVGAFGPAEEVVTEKTIKDQLAVDIKTLTDPDTGVRYFVPRAWK